MDLKKFLPGADTKSNQEYYWALVVEPGWVQAGIWKIQDKKALVVHESQPVAWEVDSDLVGAADTALSSAFQEFPDDTPEPTKTVFGVSYSWVEEGEISSDNLEKIKTICKELSLSPVGFVVLPEAISHFTKSEEGTPLNAVILAVYREIIEVSLFELGKLAGTTSVARSVSLIDDLVEGLSRLATGKTLPSRFLIYDGKEGDLEEAEQALVKADWDTYSDIKFLHTPKIEIFDTNKKVHAVSLAGASEIADVNKLENTKPVPVAVEKPPESVIAEDKVVEADDGDKATLEDLGFALEKDVNDFGGSSESKLEKQEVDYPEEVENVSPVEYDEPIQKHPARILPKPDFTGIKKTILSSASIMKKLKFGFPKISWGQNPLFIGLSMLLILGLLGLAWWWFYPKAVVTIYVSSEKLDQKAEVFVDTERDESDLSGKILAGEKIDGSVSGEKTKDTTGTKTIGDKAKGEVTIYRVGTEINLPAGTVLNGSQNLKFVMDSSVKIASGSASSPGESKVSVTAEAFGAQYNLASGSTFSVVSYSSSDMEGKNSSALSGGTSRDINAVSDTDQKTLLQELETELKDKAKDEIVNKIDENQFLVEGSIVAERNEEEFSHKVGDEADTLKLNMDLAASAVAVENEELIKLAREILKEKIPSGFILRDEQIEFDFQKVNDTEKPNSYELKITANLLPQIDTEDLRKKIVGKYPQVAQDYLNRGVPGFVRAEIRTKPSLPGKLKTLPHVAKNIEVEISAER